MQTKLQHTKAIKFYQHANKKLKQTKSSSPLKNNFNSTMNHLSNNEQFTNLLNNFLKYQNAICI